MKSPRLEAVIGTVLLVATPLSAQTWTQSFGLLAPDGIASSADGTKLAAVNSSGGPIFTSTNSGASWNTNIVPPGDWNAIASSADGNTFVACAKLQYIYVSTNAGVDWTSNSTLSANAVSSLAISADGTKVVGVGAGKFAMLPGHIYTSSNTGASWTETAAPRDTWTSVACSADGNKIVAVSRDWRIVTSTNFGLTWATNDRFSPLQSEWISVASSSDGNDLVAASDQQGVAPGGAIYTSSDSGATWVSNNVPGAPWWSVASSADGEKLIADYQYGTYIYTSADAGVTWTSNNVPGISAWTCASSADGGELVANAENGIWILQTAPPPQLNITSYSSNLDLSWLVPSTNYVLQQSSDLANWQSLTNLPALNLTNLQDEVFLSPTNDSAFFRLISQ